MSNLIVYSIVVAVCFGVLIYFIINPGFRKLHLIAARKDTANYYRVRVGHCHAVYRIDKNALAYYDHDGRLLGIEYYTDVQVQVPDQVYYD